VVGADGRLCRWPAVGAPPPLAGLESYARMAGDRRQAVEGVPLALPSRSVIRGLAPRTGHDGTEEVLAKPAVGTPLPLAGEGDRR
jgi:hypothetical protein